MNQPSDFSTLGPCYVGKRTYSSAFQGNSCGSSSGRTPASSEEQASVAAERGQAGQDLRSPEKSRRWEMAWREGTAEGEVVAVVELPLLKHSNWLTAASPRSSYTPPVAHLSPDAAMCVGRDKSSLPTWGSSPPAGLIASQRGKQPSWEMPGARLLARSPCLLPFASVPAFPCAPGLPARPCSPRGRHVPLINELHLHPKINHIVMPVEDEAAVQNA